MLTFLTGFEREGVQTGRDLGKFRDYVKNI